ncbi:MAG: Cna B-type domain-containing protein, partial [Clostridiales bacterium]|nr:Cna B-type domain-containing protein [Clostridiales bacterium]
VADQIRNGGFNSNYTAKLYTVGLAISDSAYHRNGTTDSGPNVTGDEWLQSIADKHYTVSNVVQLNLAFEKIAQTIVSVANAWIVTDPMAEYIVLDSIVPDAFNNATNDGGTLVWNIKSSDPVRVEERENTGSIKTEIFVYELKYRATLDNLVELGGGRYQAEDKIPTNDRTTLTYVVDSKTADEYDDDDFITVDFAIPQIFGFDTAKQAQFNFDKVDPSGTPIEGAKFQLYVDGQDPEDKFGGQKTSDENGFVDFGPLPSGHTYYLQELSAPVGYVPDGNYYELAVEFGKLRIIDANGNLKEKAGGGFAFVNEPNICDVTGTKVWLDNGNAYGTRTDITVWLLRDGIYYKSQLLKLADFAGENEWEFTFANLPRLSDIDGHVFEYEFQEVELANYSSDAAGATITNTLTPGETSVTVSKTWDDNNDAKGRRPESVTFRLLADGVEVSTHTMAAPWADYKFAGLPKYDDNQELISYALTEDGTTGYTTTGGTIEDGSATFTNTFTQIHNDGTLSLKKQVDGTLIANWEHNGISIVDVRDDMSFKLYRAIMDAGGSPVGYDDSAVVATAEFGASGEISFDFVSNGAINGWYAVVESFTPDSLAEELFEDVGSLYVFFVDGVGVGGTKANFDYNAYYTIINGYGQGYVLGYPGLNNSGDIFPIGVENAETGEKYPSFCANGGSVSFYEGNGNYLIAMQDLVNGVSLADYIKAYNYIEAKYGSVDDCRVVTQIVTWVLLGAIKVPSAEFDNIDWAAVAAGTGAVKGVPNAKAIVEDVVANYSNFVFSGNEGIVDVVFMVGKDNADYSVAQPQLVPVYGGRGFNNKIKGFVDITAEKNWVDNEDSDGTRPESITVQLLQDGIVIDACEVTGEGETWSCAFTGLQKYSAADQHEYVYTVDEVLPEGYSKVVDGYTITNTLLPGTTSVSGSKVWVDAGDADGTRPDSITVNLLANGAVADSKTVSSPWTYEFADLPK